MRSPDFAAKLQRVNDRVAGHLEAIGRNFTSGRKILVISWDPAFPDGRRDYVLGDEPIDEAIRRLQIRSAEDPAKRDDQSDR